MILKIDGSSQPSRLHYYISDTQRAFTIGFRFVYYRERQLKGEVVESKTSVTAALKQAQELIDHANRNNLPPDLHWLAQLGRAYSSSVGAEISDTCRSLEEKQGLLDRRFKELQVALDSFDLDAVSVEEVVAPEVTPDPSPMDIVGDSFTPEQNRSLLERCLQRIRRR